MFEDDPARSLSLIFFVEMVSVGRRASPSPWHSKRPTWSWAGGRHLRSGRASESVIWPMMSGKFLRGMDGQLPPQGWIPARRAAAGRRRADRRRSQFTKFCQGHSVRRGIVEKAIPLQSLRPSVGQLIPCCLPICPSGEGTPWSPFALVRSPLSGPSLPLSTSTLASRYPFSVRVSSFPDIAPLRRR